MIPVIPNNPQVVYWSANAFHQGSFPVSGNPTSFAATGLPAGTSINTATGVISGTPTVAHFYTATITATNADGSGTGTLYFNIGPVFPVVSPTDQDGIVGAPFSYFLPINAGNPSAWQVSGLPTGFTLSSVGEIAGTPTHVGIYPVTVSADYGDRHSQGQSFHLTFDPADGAQLTVADETLHVQVGEYVNYQVNITGTYTSVDQSGLGTGDLLMLNHETGVISGVVTEHLAVDGGAHIVITATNDDGESASGTITVIVDAPPPPAPVEGSNLAVEINVVTGAASITNGAPSAFYGDQIIVEADFIPPGLAENITNVSFWIKEKSEVQQYQVLVANVGSSADGTRFVFPVTSFVGDALLHSLLLLDGVAPSMAVSYSVQFFYRWNGRARKSAILDFSVSRPEDLDAAEIAGLTGTNPQQTYPQS